MGFKYAGTSAFNSEVWMLCVIDEDQRWFINDAFPSGRPGILARAVFDPQRGYWAAYQNGLTFVQVETDANHRVFIVNDGFTGNAAFDPLVTSSSDYPEVNWAIGLT